MMAAETKKAVRARLRRIAGQVQAIERMVDADRYCIDLMHQLAAVQAAIGKVSEEVLRSHVRTCVADAIRAGDERECARKTEELVAVFGRYRSVRGR
jgi:DNA-binding FrmR family transcriptional regulator